MHSTGEPTRPRVLIASDVRLYCEGLRTILGDWEGIDLVGTADDSESLLAAVGDCRPDVVTLDMGMRGGPQVARRMREIAPGLKIVALAVREVEEEIISCAEAGVDGYVTREESTADLVAAIHAAMQGDMHCSSRVAGVLSRRVSSLARSRPRATTVVRLTRRELDVVRLMEPGLSNKEIARHLSIETATVKNHVHSVLVKFGVRSRAEAAAAFRRSPLWPGENSGMVPQAC